jgi:hypothetical protein
MASDSFHQFKWIQAFPDEMLVRTVRFENAAGAEPLAEDNLFDEPTGMAFWEPESGKVLRLPFDAGHPTYTKPPEPRTLLAYGAEWEWSLDGAAWEKGTTPLGYGDKKVNAVTLPEGLKPLSILFRNRFDVADASKVARLFFDIKVDDGCSIWLNGHEVARHNLPAGGALTPETLALKKMVGWRFRDGIPLPIDPKHLKPGANVVEVRVHQQSPKSSDLMFDMAVRVKE